MSVTRRGFLQLCGLTVATIPLAPTLPAMPIGNVVRVLQLVEARLWPGSTAPASTTLFADSVHAVYATRDGWVQLADGYVPMQVVQPMVAANHQTLLAHIQRDTWVEVIAPYVAIRKYASVTAPLVLRADHGDVFVLNHSFRDDDGVWWAQTARGWLQIRHVQQAPVASGVAPILETNLTLIPQWQALAVMIDGDRVAQVRACMPSTVPDDLELDGLLPGTADGRPWNLRLTRNWVIYGEGSHNDFGEYVRRTPPGSVEIATNAARWLYALLQSSKVVRIQVQR